MDILLGILAFLAIVLVGLLITLTIMVIVTYHKFTTIGENAVGCLGKFFLKIALSVMGKKSDNKTTSVIDNVSNQVQENTTNG